MINTLFVSAIIAFGDGARVGPVARQTFWHGLPSTAGEAALAYALARRALNEPWAIVALVPLVFAVYYAHARLAALRRETARALETFANVVDERDPSTFHHSARVSEHVRRLAQGLRLPASDVARLVGLPGCTTSARSASTRRCCRSPGSSEATSGLPCAGTLGSPRGSCAASG